jgi:hypothetical protein
MDVCSFNQGGEVPVHRHMQAGPETFLKAIAPYRENLVVCVACICMWSWLADRCVPEGIPFIPGHALSMEALHGARAKHDPLDA